MFLKKWEAIALMKVEILLQSAAAQKIATDSRK
jgi:hypothetical protein